VLSEFTLTENLYGTFCTSKIYGTVDDDRLNSPLLVSILAVSTKILSCAKYGTSYHLIVPLSDVTDVI
jgi:hypothetical protein